MPRWRPTATRSCARANVLAIASLLALTRRPDAPFYLAAVGLYLLVRAGSFVYTPVRVTDTPTYEQVAAEPVWSGGFWGGQRPFTVPLLWKVLGEDHLRIAAHLFVSVACWVALAAAVGLCVRHGVLQKVAFCLVLAFSATTEIILWDPLLLSESISLSLTALVLAGWLSLVRAPSWTRVAALLAVTVLWTFTRDSHAYVVLFSAFVVAASLLQRSHRPMKVVLALGSVAIFALSTASANAGQRWYQPLRDILLNRVDKDAEMAQYFGERLGPMWKDADARRVYARYLVSHPRYTFVEPFFGSQTTPFSTPDNASALLDPDLRIYNDNAADRPFPLPRSVSDLFYVQGKRSIVFLLLIVVGTASVVALRFGASWLWAVPAAVVVSTVPHALVAYHLSGLEVDRHALEAALLLRLGLLVLAVLACDAVLQYWSVRATAAERTQQPA
jgi:hypothetical protein